MDAGRTELQQSSFDNTGDVTEVSLIDGDMSRRTARM
jgi:hypothetical protein